MLKKMLAAAGAAEYMEKTPFQLSRAFSPGVITEGGKIVWVAGQTATRDNDGNHNGFVFKNILGCNHLKMQSERMALGVSLDLPLSAGTLAAMAAPYQEEFRTRVQDDSTFRAALKKAR